MFSLIFARINGWANNENAGDLRRHLTHYDVIVMAHFQMLDNWNAFLMIRDIHISNGQII